MKIMKRIALLTVFVLIMMCMVITTAEEINQPSVFSDELSEHFLAPGEAPVVEEMSYTSENLAISIAFMRENRSDIYVADIWVRDLSLLRRGFGGGRWKTKMNKIPTIAGQENAILALTGDNGHRLKGIVFANGKLLRKKPLGTRDVCIIYNDGTMEVVAGKQITADKLNEITGSVWQSFLFGPGLLDKDGQALTKFSSKVAPANPRAAIGYYEPGHYCFVQVDGRGTKSRESGKNTGMKLKELAAFMEKLGCKAAYNLDGGQSALMWFNGRVISTPYHGGRTVGDIVYLKDSITDSKNPEGK